MQIFPLIREYVFGVLMLALLQSAWLYLVTDGNILGSIAGGLGTGLAWAYGSWQQKRKTNP